MPRAAASSKVRFRCVSHGSAAFCFASSCPGLCLGPVSDNDIQDVEKCSRHSLALPTLPHLLTSSHSSNMTRKSLLSLFLLAPTLFAEQVVKWNDSRVLVNRPSANLWSVSWDEYDASTRTGPCGTNAWPNMCGGTGSLCWFYDSASMLFNGGWCWSQRSFFVD